MDRLSFHSGISFPTCTVRSPARLQLPGSVCPISPSAPPELDTKKDNESAKKDDEPPTGAQEARHFVGESI